MERIPDVQVAVASALLTLGDGNWKMGEGVKVVGSKSAEVDEQTILEHYMCTFTLFILAIILSDFVSFGFIDDVVNTLLATLNTISRTNKRPAFGAIFLLNNVFYLNTHLIDQPHADVSTLLSKPTTDALTSNFRIAKAGYFDTNFSPLMSCLQEDKDKSKSATKERFTRFYDMLEEVAERHRVAKVLHEDKAGRETVCEEVVKLVIPSLQRFTQRNTGKEFSKST
jgi:exocyst complex component 7